MLSSGYTLGFSKHLHCYEVAILNSYVTTNYNELLDYHPLDIYTVKVQQIERKIIRMRYDLGDCEHWEIQTLYKLLLCIFCIKY